MKDYCHNPDQGQQLNRLLLIVAGLSCLTANSASETSIQKVFEKNAQPLVFSSTPKFQKIISSIIF